ncbi:NAD(P)H-quinone oxidoreductase [Cellulomonas pakistanensis]|uniref:NAD(P)H quinone oxidoreductase n=1 Tax=Cellulomonas pakistanensis TaxID=992287 RepID=A0A919PA50_9CELL|nr:NAD(P)H-quinone oxidoreductase [Cellulomonas pakistanensis]GIG35821.1 NAD(P)H quinone oxidoreductase [Cellulomonas pakistanensis]
MDVVEVKSPGGPDRLEAAVRPDPEPGPGEVLVRVAAAGVNRADLLQREGRYPPPPGAPDWPGLEVSGVVAGHGPGVDAGAWPLGARVAALLPGGGYATLVTVPAGLLLPVPDELDLVDAAGLPEALLTAWTNVVDAGRLAAGEVLLVQGGSGGVGSVAVQLGAALGAHVVATAGGAERAERCRALGARTVVDHRTQDVAEAVRAATGGHGADVVLDVLGAGGLATNLAALATGGRLVVIGTQRGARGEIDLGLLMARRASVIGTTLRARPPAEKERIVADVREHAWPMLSDGRLRPVVHARLPLARAADAHRLLDSGEVFGKVLLVP